ncbi:hypothetical protein OEZ86_005963 [Tetradesmus obliquus]|nr:hypothetical protein OEZ86_005963 [Tetradesmus obliquus]
MAQSGGGSPGRRTSGPGGNLSDTVNLQVLRHLESVFRSADANGSGELDMEEFVAAFKGVISTPEGSDDEALRKLFMRIDANCDATVGWDELSAYLLLEKTNSSGGAAAQGQAVPDGSSGRTFSTTGPPVLQPGVAHRELISSLMHVDTGNGPDKWYSAGKDGTVRVWNGKAGAGGMGSHIAHDLSHLRTLQTPLQCITAAAYLPGSSLLALGSYSPSLLLVDPASGEQAGRLPAAAGSAALSLAGWQEGGGGGLGLGGGREQLAVGDADGGVSLMEVLADDVADKKSIDRYHGRQLWRCVNHHDWVVGLTPLPQLSSLLAASLDKQLTMTDLERRIAVKTLSGHEKAVTCCAWSGMYKMAISGGADRLLVLWNPFSSRPLGQLAGHVAPLVAVAVNEREHQVISAAADKTIKVWDLRNQRCLQTLQDRATHSPEDTLTALAYSPSRKLLVSAAYSLRAWPLTDGAAGGCGHRDPVSWVGFNPMFCEAVSTDHAGTVCVWHVASGKLRFAFANTHGSCRISAATFDSNHRRLITGAEDGSVKVWNFSSGALLSTLATPDYSREWGSGSGAEVTGLAVSGSNNALNLVVAGWDRKVTWYDDSGKRRCNLLRSSSGPGSDILAAAPMQGYPTLATACYNGEVWLWNLESGAVRRKLLPQGHASRPVNEQPVERLAFMHGDARHILVAVGADRMLRFWECFSGALLCEHFTAHQQGESVAGLALAPDNSSLVTADTAGYIMVWDISSLRFPAANRAAPSSAAAGSRPSSAATAAAAAAGSRGGPAAAAAAAGSNLGFLVSASLDSSLCLWSSAGALVGVFGRHRWSLDDIGSWQSSTRALLKAGEEFDMLVSSSQLTPPPPAAAAAPAAAASSSQQQPPPPDLAKQQDWPPDSSRVAVMAALVCVGDRLASEDSLQAGTGTYVRGGFIYASIVGLQQVVHEGTDEAVVQVVAKGAAPVVPEPGSIVIAKVTKVSPTAANARIVCCGAQALEADFSGVIRQQDVRTHEIDKVVMYDCFRPGDIVRAKVLSLGDARSYHLSTADNSLGVVRAKSLAGVAMVPVSWQEMQCPQTKAVERRKVAKVEEA